VQGLRDVDASVSHAVGLIQELNSQPNTPVPWAMAVEIFARVHRIRSNLIDLGYVMFDTAEVSELQRLAKGSAPRRRQRCRRKRLDSLYQVDEH
jgi:hypothetical protein